MNKQPNEVPATEERRRLEVQHVYSRDSKTYENVPKAAHPTPMDEQDFTEANRNEFESNELGPEPNGVDPSLHGQSFQQQPFNEFESNELNRNNTETYEQTIEPNGMDPASSVYKFEHGQTFQQTPEEIEVNGLGEEPNGMDPNKR